uniref:Zinc finger PHD-type domain-containing protein n=1 Tax=Panagrolaimus sp. ES5 TaxID=591445 RepID=A0AC34FZS9_9BILA
MLKHFLESTVPSATVSESAASSENKHAAKHTCSKCILANNNNKKESDEWIQCNACSQWYHLTCVKVEEFQVKLIKEFHCLICVETSGPSLMKQILSPHRYNFWDPSEKDLPTQIGTKPWIDKFANEIANNVELFPIKSFNNGMEFMNSFNFDQEFREPVKILDIKGLGMKLPAVGFDIDRILQLVSGDEIIPVIDVFMQETNRMTLGAFAENWKQQNRERLYNMLSFEFSHTP